MLNKINILIVIFFSCVLNVYSNENTQSILQQIKSFPSEKEKVNYLLNFSDSIIATNSDSSEQYVLLADSLAKLAGLNSFNGEISYLKGQLAFKKGNYIVAQELFFIAEKQYHNYNNILGVSKTYDKLGLVNISQADFTLALDYFLKSLALKDSIGDTQGISDTYSNMGNVLFEMYDLNQALVYYLKSIEIDKENNNEEDMARTLMNVGVVYKEQFDYEKAIEYYQRSLKIHESIGNQQEIANCFFNIALVYLENGNGTDALDFYNKALKIYESMGAKKGITSVLSDIGFYYSLEGKYTIAIDYLKKAIRIAQEINSVQDIERISQAISAVYQKIGNYKEAYNYYMLYKSMYDKLNNDENARLFTQMEMNYDFEQQKKEIEYKQQQKEIEHRAEIKRQRMLLIFMLSGAVALLAFAIFIYRSYQQKKKDNELLRTQKNAIEEQRDEINKQKKDITDSIHYAKRIQTALLPPDDLMNKLLLEHFVLYKPRDIVSGDYYWISEKENKTVIVAADCTGHGVPGAFMSMLGMSFLNEIIQLETDLSCSNILNKLREYVIKSLRQTGAIGEAKDGMDLSILIIDRENNKLQFSGAYNPLLLIRNGEIILYKADKMPIGISDKSGNSFLNHEIEMAKNDTFYMFSDGYVDQFGGPSNKKYKSKHFKELLLGIQSKSMNEQKEILDNTIEKWRGEYEQIDDILVLGIKM